MTQNLDLALPRMEYAVALGCGMSMWAAYSSSGSFSDRSGHAIPLFESTNLGAITLKMQRLAKQRQMETASAVVSHPKRSNTW
jgi:hypothetical protein